ncbi:MAG: VOC family protein [Candidatus Saccharimonadales bacterium]
MLNDKDVYTMLPVDDMAAAKKFYGETLGLKEAGSDPSGMGSFYTSGKTRVMVYQSKYAGTNKGTAANWGVDDVDAVAKQLKDKGVKFEHYDFPETTREGDVHIWGEIRSAWFKDPAGNILGITN